MSHPPIIDLTLDEDDNEEGNGEGDGAEVDGREAHSGGMEWRERLMVVRAIVDRWMVTILLILI